MLTDDDNQHGEENEHLILLKSGCVVNISHIYTVILIVQNMGWFIYDLMKTKTMLYYFFSLKFTTQIGLYV